MIDLFYIHVNILSMLH